MTGIRVRQDGDWWQINGDEPEALQYIAETMRETYARTKDAGALEIAEAIEKAGSLL